MNQTFLYQTTSRNSLFYNPLVFQNHLNINGLIFPEHLFEENQNQLIKITRIKEENLKKRAIPPQVLRIGNIVSWAHFSRAFI